jgi:peroxiredoxin
LRSFQEKLGEFEKRGVRLLAVSVDPVATTREHARKQGYTYTFLSDEMAEVIRRYGLLHEGGFRGLDISRPAEFLVARNGTVLWANFTSDYRVRLKGEEALKVIDEKLAARK